MQNERFVTKEELDNLRALLVVYLPLYKSHLNQENEYNPRHEVVDVLIELVRATDAISKKIAVTKDFLSMSEAAHYLGISESNLYKKVNSRVIPYYKPDGLIYFYLPELKSYFLESRIKSIAESSEEVEKFVRAESCLSKPRNRAKKGNFQQKKSTK